MSDRPDLEAAYAEAEEYERRMAHEHMTLRRIMVETPCEHGIMGRIHNMEGGDQGGVICPGGTRSDRTVVLPEAIEAAALALVRGYWGEDDPDYQTPNADDLLVAEAAINAFLSVQYGIENNEAD